ncbi:MAG: HAD family hydrolase [Kiritimatiellae bacterium]|nr:HAD family hydrolase [Kiritimatiellia bacterium]MCO5068306.1 HAD family hydrolase [Kiritimatiellia bacterium]
MNTAQNCIRHIVWDWNGTLLDDTDLCIEIMNELLDERAMPRINRERYREVFDFPVQDYYARLGFNFAKDPFEIVGAEFIRRYEEQRTTAPLHAAARATLQALEINGFSQSVLSAYRQDTLESLLAHFRIRPHFDDVIGSDNVYALGKIERGKQWIETRDITPSSVLLIGDTRHDFEVAEAMHCPCLLIAAGYHSRARLEPLSAPVVNTLSEVPAWIALRNQPTLTKADDAR